MPEKIKKGWTRVAFGDVVVNRRDQIIDREAAGIERIVGLDDLVSGDLRIRSWKNIADSPSFRTHFKPGHTLFGKRRAYLRKVALAEFEGVCTQNILVLESRDPNVLLPELLPFLCSTETFFEHAISTSEGSLFPNANWDAMAQYEFALPPFNEQRRIAEVLGAYDSLCKGLNCAGTHVHALIHSLARSSMAQLERSSTPLKSLAEIGAVLTGRTPSSSEPGCWGDEVFFATPGDMGFVEPHLRSCERALTQHGASQSVVVPTGSILVVCIGSTIGKVARCDVPMAFNQQINAVVPEGVESWYLFMCLLECGHQLAARKATTAVPIVNKNAFSQIRVPVPPLDKQVELVACFSGLLKVREAIGLRCGSARTGKNTLLEVVLGTKP